MNKQKGFTLVELLIVVAIVGILAKIALPMYTSYLVRGKLVEAQSTLTSARVAMEQYYQDHRTYTGGDASVSASPAGICPAATTYFTYSCSAPTSTTYTLTASSNAGQGLGAANDYVYTIDQSNSKATTTFAGTANASACWISKSGQSC
jgi:type IV pilus assembly protein PilE